MWWITYVAIESLGFKNPNIGISSKKIRFIGIKFATGERGVDQFYHLQQMTRADSPIYWIKNIIKTCWLAGFSPSNQIMVHCPINDVFFHVWMVFLLNQCCWISRSIEKNMFHSEMDIFSQFPGKDLNEENDAFSAEALLLFQWHQGSTGISIRKHWKTWETSWDMNFWEKPILVGGLEHGLYFPFHIWGN